MDRPLRLLHIAAHVLEERFDLLRYRARRRLGWIRPVTIMPFLGHGTPGGVHLKGRVLERRGLGEAGPDRTVWQNLRAMYRRFATAEIPFVRVRACFAGDEQVVETDNEGYFDVHLRPRRPVPSGELWHDVALELLDPVVPGQGPVRATGRVQIPPSDAGYGVISDVDDTVIETHATDLLKMMQLTLLSNAHTRTPFEGVPAFYRALQQRGEADPRNPIFYVSSSPWNLYDMLVEFFQFQDMPAGTLFLRDLGLERRQFLQSSHDAHKLDQIDHVLETYPDLPFVLIGDSGQRDPEIYRAVIRAHPHRIRAVYIRDVSAGRRDAEVNAIAEEACRLGIDWLLVGHTHAAARHAAAKGLIAPSAVPQVDTGTVPNIDSMSEIAFENR